MYCDGPCTGWEWFKYAGPFLLVVALIVGFVLYRWIKRKRRDP